MLGEKLRVSAAESVSISGWFSAYGGGVLLVLVLLCVSVCVLVFVLVLYRALRRGHTDTITNTTQRAAQSTEISDEQLSEESETDSTEAVILSSAFHPKTSSVLPEVDMRETASENLNEHDEGLSPDVKEAGGPHVDHCKAHVKGEGDVRDAAESVKVEADMLAYQFEGSKPVKDEIEDCLKDSVCDVDEFEGELHGDVDEPSETESAQEMMEAKNAAVHKCQSVEDLLDNTLLAQDVVRKTSKLEISADEQGLHVSLGQQEAEHSLTKTDDDGAVPKGFENGIDCRVPQVKEFDFCSYNEQSDLLGSNLVPKKVQDTEDQASQHDYTGSVTGLGMTLVNNVDSNRYNHSYTRYDPVLDRPPQNYLGFTVPSLPADFTGRVQIRDPSKVKSELVASCDTSGPALASHDKNEINIMEAIMDSNEWLSTGPPDTRDLPWLKQAQSNTSYGSKTATNMSSVTSATSNTIFVSTTDVPWPKSAPANISFGSAAEEKTQGLTVAPEHTVIGVADDEDDCLSKKVAAVSPMPQMVQVKFRVHYVTHSPSQLLAVTGNQQELGAWESFVPLQRVEDWYWANTVPLPAENQVEWKFVLVEDGKIRRWEECENRQFTVMGQEEQIHLDKSWGFV